MLMDIDHLKRNTHFQEMPKGGMALTNTLTSTVHSVSLFICILAQN